MAESIRLTVTLPATPKRVYEAWLSSQEHTAFTGDHANIDPVIGGEFVAWGGYLNGKTLELKPYSRIVQSWRSTDFPESAEDSRLEVRLQEARSGTMLTLLHTNIPDGQGDDYKQGWRDYYFQAMKRYFSEMDRGR